MIVKIFDQGWGREWPAKQFENHMVERYLAPVIQDPNRRVVVINSTWYSQDFHAEVMRELRMLQPDLIVIVAMADPAIPQPQWFSDVGCEIRSIGYYRGQDCLDYWAMMCANHMQISIDPQDCAIDTAYLCMNRKPHWHRRKLYRDLEINDLLDRGLVSLGHESGVPIRSIPGDLGQSDMAPNPGTDQFGIANDITSLGSLSNWHRCFLNVVTETVFDVDREWFVSEKIYKPIIGLKPFLVYAPNSAQEWLHSAGFETYVRDFEDITDLDISDPANMVDFLQTLAAQGASYWQHKKFALRDKLQYNKERFSGYTAEIVHKLDRGIQCQT